MFRKSEVKPASRAPPPKGGRRKSAASNNLYLSPSLIGKFRKFVGGKQTSDISKSSSNNADKQSPAEIKASKGASRLTSNLPDDAAVHFGSFYGVEQNESRVARAKGLRESAPASRKPTPRLEFTRQMVQKLERTAGTEDYARQVSALLEETVEPAHFKLHSMPTENSIPDGRYNPTGFPLWYKEPYKMPFASDEIYKLLKEKFDKTEGRARDVFKEDSSSEASSLEEWSDNEERGDGENYRDDWAKSFLARQKSSANLLSSGSFSVTEAKDTDSTESIEIPFNRKHAKLALLQQR
ncbi:PREDICTED: uncharacterized protein LOC108550150 [Eufriesea mexicana]|uniref:uncharacterized protein LOC108550150 n=1 Tax=Eufriesea mexicana TaxID=516756 RepID=UPI00083C4447|nr:PREDICTED: uncharacterized protein LOC108550150 [Eufriesea mexicana]